MPLQTTRLDAARRIYFLRGLEARTFKIKTVSGAGFVSAAKMMLDHTFLGEEKFYVLVWQMEGWKSCLL